MDKQVRNQMMKKNTKTPSHKTPGRAPHDPLTPEALKEFMMTGWKAPGNRKVAAIKGASRFAKRRDAVSKSFAGTTLVVPAGHEQTRANDTTFRFRPSSDFYYLSGNQEADCVLVMLPKGKSGHEDILFVEENPGRTDPSFFTDRVKGELWVGPRLGVAESKLRYEVERTEPLSSLPTFLAEAKKSGAYRVVRGISPLVDK
ncbi:aminopeptidase P N-terminal domain-containing protein, partial [Myxococcota bacterium]|nr:aminopeptidase P N-terminal domain-containing protein [Myxococcota bacterium]